VKRLNTVIRDGQDKFLEQRKELTGDDKGATVRKALDLLIKKEGWRKEK